jgi:predicted dehydrogenase
MKKLNVAIIGTKFMGKAHSSSWSRVHRFFDVPFEPVLKVACGQTDELLRSFADRWGWESISKDWKETVNRQDVDIVDIAAPTFLHHDMAIEAAKAGKHVFCEKPLCLTYQQAVEMRDAVEKAGIVHYLNHNYRRCPAVSLARQFISEGRLGRLFHWRSAYLQSWIVDPEFPLTWHLRKEAAGSGPHADLNSHLVDLARFLVGDIIQVTAMTAQFIKERPLPDEGTSGAFEAGRRLRRAERAA